MSKFISSNAVLALLWQTFTSRKPHMAYVSGWRGHRNLGDEVLFHAAGKLFQQAKLIPYPHDNLPSLRTYQKFYGKFAVGLLAGGTLINRAARECVWAKECFTNSNRSLIFGTGVADPAFYSGRLKWNDSMYLWRSLFECCDFVGVRGPKSLQLLLDQGINNVQVVGDPILVFAGDQASSAKWKPNVIGLNLTSGERQVWGSQNHIYSQYVDLARIAKQAQWQVHWFVVWEEDLAMTREAAKQSATDQYIHVIYKDYKKFFNLVSRVSVFVGMKLHATAMATCRYVPSIMIEYRPKCRDYMASIGQESACIRSDRFDVSDVWEICKEWNNQRDYFSTGLFNSINPIRQLQRNKAMEIIKSMTPSNA